MHANNGILNGEDSYTMTYACTITLKPVVRRDSCEIQYDKYTSYVVKTIKDRYPNCLLKLMCEMTKSYDLHFHGTISFMLKHKTSRIKNYLKHFSDSFRGDKIIGFVLLKHIDNDKVWDEYITKSINDFESTTGRSATASSY